MVGFNGKIRNKIMCKTKINSGKVSQKIFTYIKNFLHLRTKGVLKSYTSIS